MEVKCKSDVCGFGPQLRLKYQRRATASGGRKKEKLPFPSLPAGHMSCVR